jgi:P4 family phage/plasmid primase-like protien
MDTATEITEGHYQRPEVKEVILKLCSYAGGLRGLNGDEGWYSKGPGGSVKLRGPGDYDDTTARARSLYMTADVFDPKVFDLSAQWIEGRGGEGRPEFPLGTRGDLISYSLFADIDAVKDPRGPDGSKLFHEGRIEALEAAASFMVQYLKDRGISESVGVLFSGQGIYVWLYPALSDVSENRALAGFDREKQDHDFKVWLEAFNALLYDIEKAFFEEYPEHVGRVKFDKLNNQKRKIKCLLSIHKTMPFAVVPLDRDDVKIDLERARLTLDGGLPSETIAEAEAWLDGWKAGEGERKALISLLKPYAAKAERDISRKANTSGEISRASEPIPILDWCPFYQALGKFPGGTGAHRVCGALAAWLYQAGWEEGDAFDLWYNVAARCDVETRIFFTAYGVINSPSCRTIQKTSAGYPSLGFGGLNLCNPNEKCEGAVWPGQYGTQPKDELSDFCVEVSKKDGGTYFKFSPTKATDALIGKYFVLAASKIDTEIYWYDGQIYRPDGERKIDLKIVSVVEDRANGRDVQEVTRRIRNRLLESPVEFDPDPFLLGLRNGVADLRTGEVRAYRPDDLITDMIEVDFDPAARCPQFLGFLETSAPHISDRFTLIDWFVATAIKLPLPYVLFLLGLGRNGKGLYENVIKRFFGGGAFRDMALAEITRNNFAAASFYKKRGWIASEQSGKRKSTIGTDFMKLTSGDGTIDGDRKNKSRIQFRPYFQTIVDTNAMPKIEDTSIGWMERFVKVDLPYVYVAEPNPENPLERKKDPLLLSKLTTDEELSGILNLILWRAPAVSKTMTIHKRPAAVMFAEYTRQSASVLSFLEAFCEYDPEIDQEKLINWAGRHPTYKIYEYYKKWCSAMVGEVVDEAYFGRSVKRFCGGRDGSRTKDSDGRNCTYYRGLLFYEDKAKEAIDLLLPEISGSSIYSQVDRRYNTIDSSQEITVSQVSQVKAWDYTLKRFGPSPYRREYGKNGLLPVVPEKPITGDVEEVDSTREIHTFVLHLPEKLDEMDQVLSEMERKGEAYHVEVFEMEFDLREGEGAPKLTARGWEERSPKMYYPPTRM